MSNRSHIALVLLVALLLVRPTVAGAQGGGTIEGAVINGTADTGPVEGLEVRLRVFVGMEESTSLTATTDAQGTFRFENLDTSTDRSYLVLTTYQGVTYSQGLLSFEPGQDAVSVELLVYATTTDDAQVGVERAHLFLTLSEGGVEATELYVFVNTGDRTYVGTEEVDGRLWTSQFTLPEGGHDLVFDDGSLGGRFLPTESGFVDTEPQWPGSTSVMFHYALDCERGECDLSREIEHPIANLNVLVPEAAVQVQSAQLTFEGRRDAQGAAYLNYVGRDLAPGQRLDLRLRLEEAGPAPAVSQSRGTQSLPWIILGAVLVGLALIYPFWRRRIESAAREATGRGK
jgi:hypothetical protein